MFSPAQVSEPGVLEIQPNLHDAPVIDSGPWVGRERKSGDRTERINPSNRLTCISHYAARRSA